MISNYARLKVLLSGNQNSDPFWSDISNYRASFGMPSRGFRDVSEYKKWRNSEPNGVWSEDAAKELFKPRQDVVIELDGPPPSALWFPKYDFRHFNQVAYSLARKYKLDSTGSIYKKLTDILLYNDTALKLEDVNQPVDIFSTDFLDAPQAELYLVLTKHARAENFITYTKKYADVFEYFQKYISFQRKPSFVARLNLERQVVEVRIFKNTKPSAIKKSWSEIKSLQEELDDYSPQTKDPYDAVLLAVAEVKDEMFTRRSSGGLRRLTMDEKLKKVKLLSKITIGESQYKEYKRLINKIKNGR